MCEKLILLAGPTPRSLSGRSLSKRVLSPIEFVIISIVHSKQALPLLCEPRSTRAMHDQVSQPFQHVSTSCNCPTSLHLEVTPVHGQLADTPRSLRPEPQLRNIRVALHGFTEAPTRLASPPASRHHSAQRAPEELSLRSRPSATLSLISFHPAPVEEGIVTSYFSTEASMPFNCVLFDGCGSLSSTNFAHLRLSLFRPEIAPKAPF